MEDYENDQQIVAYHEAGHGVMAIACGFTVTELSIIISENRAGYVGYQIPHPIVAETAKKAALVCAAGLAADMLLARASGKKRQGDAFLGHFNDQESGRHFISQTGEAGTFDDYLVFSTIFLKQNWSIVDMVAKSLLEFTTLNPAALDFSKFPTLPVNWQVMLRAAIAQGDLPSDD